MNILKPLVLFLFILTSCEHSDNKKLEENEIIKPIEPFSSFEFDKAVAYDFAGDTDVPLINENNQLTKFINKQVQLDTVQLNEFMKIIMDSTTFGALQAKDFYPHLGIVFYKNNKIVEFLEVSLVCSGLHATFPIKDLDKREYPENGLTERGKEKIYYFCRKLGFKEYLGAREDLEYQPRQ